MQITEQNLSLHTRDTTLPSRDGFCHGDFFFDPIQPTTSSITLLSVLGNNKIFLRGCRTVNDYNDTSIIYWLNYTEAICPLSVSSVQSREYENNIIIIIVAL